MIHLCLTSDPANLNQVCAMRGRNGEAWMCLCAWRTPACAEWQVWTVPGITGLLLGHKPEERWGYSCFSSSFLSPLSSVCPAGHKSVHVYHLNFALLTSPWITVTTITEQRKHLTKTKQCSSSIEETTVAQTVFRVMTWNSTSSSGSSSWWLWSSQDQTKTRWLEQADHCQGSGYWSHPLSDTQCTR